MPWPRIADVEFIGVCIFFWSYFLKFRERDGILEEILLSEVLGKFNIESLIFLYGMEIVIADKDVSGQNLFDNNGCIFRVEDSLLIFCS